MRGSNEGDKQGASSATSPSPLTSRPLFLALYLFLSRVLESGRILTRRGSYSSLDPVHSVALSSRPRPSSSPHLRTSFSRKASPFLTTTTKTKTRSRSATLSSRLAPFSIRLSLLSLSLVTSALDIVCLALFSSHSLSSRTFILILSLSFPLALSFSLSHTVSFFHLLHLRSPFRSHLPTCLHSSRKGRGRISFSFLPLQH